MTRGLVEERKAAAKTAKTLASYFADNYAGLDYMLTLDDGTLLTIRWEGGNLMHLCGLRYSLSEPQRRRRPRPGEATAFYETARKRKLSASMIGFDDDLRVVRGKLRLLPDLLSRRMSDIPDLLAVRSSKRGVDVFVGRASWSLGSVFDDSGILHPSSFRTQDVRSASLRPSDASVRTVVAVSFAPSPVS